MAEGRLPANLLRFVRLLRELGLPVGPHRALLLGEALGHVSIVRRGDFYHAGRSCLIYRQQDLAEFDRAFEAFWREHPQGGIPLTVPGRAQRQATPSDPAIPGELHSGIDPQASAAVAPLAYSAAEALRHKDFAELSAEELEAVARQMRRMDWRLGQHPGRRWRAGRGPLPDHRHTLRASLRFGGEPLLWAHRRPRPRLRPLVVLADVSGSMQPYARPLLQFLYGLSHGLDHPPEVFVFSTRLTRITRPLRRRGPQQALEGLDREIRDWSGGTRLGEALRHFNLHWARRVLSRGALLVVISDGLDRGDPALVGRELARLQRSCWRLMWLNPLLGSPDYEPLAQGMRAALPYVDDFLPCHNLDSLEAAAGLLRWAAEPARPQSASRPRRARPPASVPRRTARPQVSERLDRT
jgi:hypothetical protein